MKVNQLMKSRFRNRTEAGQLLARNLARYARRDDVLVLALPRSAFTYAAWKTLFAHEWMRFASFLFAASVLIHAWIGMRNIWMDYVKHAGLRLALQIATILWLVGCAGWAMQILWRL